MPPDDAARQFKHGGPKTEDGVFAALLTLLVSLQRLPKPLWPGVVYCPAMRFSFSLQGLSPAGLRRRLILRSSNAGCLCPNLIPLPRFRPCHRPHRRLPVAPAGVGRFTGVELLLLWRSLFSPQWRSRSGGLNGRLNLSCSRQKKRRWSTKN
jgi:hypothetical protein